MELDSLRSRGPRHPRSHARGGRKRADRSTASVTWCGETGPRGHLSRDGAHPVSLLDQLRDQRTAAANAADALMARARDEGRDLTRDEFDQFTSHLDEVR